MTYGSLDINLLKRIEKTIFLFKNHLKRDIKF